MNYTLHHCVDARSFRTLWMLEELGLPYELRMLPFPPRASAKDYLALNPLGTVPLLTTAEGVRLTESAASCQYLAARHSPGVLDVAVHETGYAAYLNWLHMSDATLTFPQTLVLRYARFEPPERRQPQVAHDYARWFLGRLRALEAALADGRPHLCAGRFTAADVAIGYAVMLATFIELPQPLPASVLAYWHGLAGRPAYTRAQAAQREAAIAQGVSTRPSPLG
ncbi:glutathione S-transferase [Ottowia sp.]|uniref:glutathione S-transferase family protein n=1 Tax=Ottowia sp. TaxID=1898956 RepID=UPI002D1A2C25|nr:glutathione S-transferase [Ottowia sp.]HRN76714.1 glutathione S-transferase [Ottowia sp.]HRQ02826.1 glutathione S-transferase [Ottowia sp.]